MVMPKEPERLEKNKHIFIVPDELKTEQDLLFKFGPII